jgi:hypothetical protein
MEIKPTGAAPLALENEPFGRLLDPKCDERVNLRTWLGQLRSLAG